MTQPKSEVLQGRLDLLVLKTLETIGPMHGWGISRRIQQVSGNALQLTQGTICPALMRWNSAAGLRPNGAYRTRIAGRGSIRSPGRDASSCARKEKAGSG